MKPSDAAFLLVGGRSDLHENTLTLTAMPAYLHPLESLKDYSMPLSSSSSKMVFPKLFIVLICFHSFSSHPDVSVFEDIEDVNNGGTENVKIAITIMLTEHVLL